MINSGRITKEGSKKREHNTAAKLTAIIGGIVFVFFLYSSVSKVNIETSVNADFGEGAYPVFNTVMDPHPTNTVPDSDVIAVEDGSVWAYLESVIARLIRGEE